MQLRRWEPPPAPAMAPTASGDDLSTTHRSERRFTRETTRAESWRLRGMEDACAILHVAGKVWRSKRAYAKATALKSDDADLWADYAFSLAMASERKLQGKPVELIKKALQLDPENPKALELAGSAAFEARDYKASYRILAKTTRESTSKFRSRRVAYRENQQSENAGRKRRSKIGRGHLASLTRVFDKLHDQRKPFIRNHRDPVRFHCGLHVRQHDESTLRPGCGQYSGQSKSAGESPASSIGRLKEPATSIRRCAGGNQPRLAANQTTLTRK